MRGEIINKLNTISIVPRSVSISALEIIESESFPLLKMEIYLGIASTMQIAFFLIRPTKSPSLRKYQI